MVFTCYDMDGFRKAEKLLAGLDFVCIWRAVPRLIVSRGREDKVVSANIEKLQNRFSFSFDVGAEDAAKARRLLIKAGMNKPKKKWIVHWQVPLTAPTGGHPPSQPALG